MRNTIWIVVAALVAVGATWVIVATVRGGNSSGAEVTAAWGSRDTTEVQLAFGPCGRSWQVSAHETSDTVMITVELDEPIRWGSSCTDEAALVSIMLDAPLGDRLLVDAGTGHTVPVGGRDDDAPS